MKALFWWLKGHKEHEMADSNQVDKTRMMGTAAFKKEINHLLYSPSFTGSDGELDAGWNSREHALVLALMFVGLERFVLHRLAEVDEALKRANRRVHLFRRLKIGQRVRRAGLRRQNFVYLYCCSCRESKFFGCL